MANFKKTLKIAVIFALVALAIFLVGMAALYLDLAGHLATGSKTYTPEGATVGRAVIVYSPGWMGLMDKAVDHVATLLAAGGYEVDVAGVSSDKARDISGYDIVIVGSPNYGKRPTDRVGAFIEEMRPDDGATIGVICTSAGVTPEGIVAMKARIQGRNMTVKAAMAMAYTEQVEPAGSDFIEALLSK